jgi:hypothetical protein
MKSKLASELSNLVLKEIQGIYLEGKMIRTNDCIDDMARGGLLEADVEKVIMEADKIGKVMPANSQRASNPLNTHYVIYGESTKYEKIYCKICSNYHPETTQFICWKLTSFCKNVEKG